SGSAPLFFAFFCFEVLVLTASSLRRSFFASSSAGPREPASSRFFPGFRVKRMNLGLGSLGWAGAPKLLRLQANLPPRQYSVENERRSLSVKYRTKKAMTISCGGGRSRSTSGNRCACSRIEGINFAEERSERQLPQAAVRAPTAPAVHKYCAA